MKKLILIFLCFFLSLSFLFSNDGLKKITPGVLESISKTEEDEKIGVIVIMTEQADLQNFKGVNRLEKLNYMQEFSELSQEPVMKAFEKMPEIKIKALKPYWIFNGFYLKATRDVIYWLAKRSDVKYIEEDLFIEYFPCENKNFDSRSHGWNIDRIKADSVWTQLGISGEGVVIGLLDSGCDVTHPALADKYLGYWFDAEGGVTPYDIYGHGTKMAGILVGGDGPGPFEHDTGVAYGAKFVVAKIDSNQSILLRHTLDAMEWVASLIQEGVDMRVISCSWGCSSQLNLGWWWAILNLRELDIYTVFAVGYFSPLGCPGNYPTLIGVGAIDFYNNLIGSSGIGPAPNVSLWADTTYWGRPDWDFIKPDIVSPGDNIPTCETGGGYCSSSGTSPATPHVAGTIALILERNPTLDYNTIYNLILDNAFRPGCGAPYPNNEYGWGILDAYQATLAAQELTVPIVKYLGHEVDDTFGNSNGIPDPGEEVEFYVRLKAFYEDVNNVEVILTTDEPGITITDDFGGYGDICADSTALNEGDPFSFSVDTSWIPGLDATFYLYISATAGTWVDTFKIQIGSPSYTVIWEDDFESGLDNWNINGNWTLSTDQYNSPSHSVYSFKEDGNNYEETHYLTLAEPIDLSDHNFAKVTFWIHEWHVLMCQWGEAFVSTPDIGQVLIADITSYQPTSISYSCDISFFAGEPEVYLEFVYTVHGPLAPAHWYLDDVQVLVDSVSFVNVEELLVCEPAKPKLSQNYPNPFNPTTTISFSTAESTENAELAIYNLKGQKVKSLINHNMEAGQHSVVWNGTDENNQHVGSGIYFYRLKTGKDFSETKRMLLLK